MNTIKKVIEESLNVLDRFSDELILYKGDWITWEMYREIKNVKTGGYIGDMLNGSYVSIDKGKYRECFRKELKSFLSQRDQKILSAIEEEVEKIKIINIPDRKTSLKGITMTKIQSIKSRCYNSALSDIQSLLKQAKE